MALLEGTNTRALSHPEVPNGDEEYTSLPLELQTAREQVPETTTPTIPLGLAPWTHLHAELSDITPENVRVSDPANASPRSTSLDLEIDWPYSKPPDLGYAPITDTEIWNSGEYKKNTGSFTGGSAANDLQHHSHLGIDASLEPQRHALQTQHDALLSYPSIFSHPVRYRENPGSSTGESAGNDLRHHSQLGIDAPSKPQRHTLQTQRGAPSAHPSINDPTHPPAPDTVAKDVVDTQESGSPTGSSTSVEFLYVKYPGIGPSSQSQQHTPQTPENTSFLYSPIPLASPVRNIEVRPQRRSYKRQKNVSHNLIDTQSQEASTHSQSAPAIRYPPVSSSSQPQRHARQNTDVSRDVVDEEAQVSGSSRTDFQDNSDLEVGPSSQHQRRSDISLVQRNKGKQPQYHPIPVAPSKRIASPASDNVRAARPYPKPASLSSARNERISNMASSSTGPRLSKRDEVTIASASSLPTVEEGVGYPTASQPSSDSPTYIPLVKSQVLQYLDTRSYHPVAPSLRTSPPVNDTVRAARPYPNPASWALARAGGTRNIASSSTGPRHSNLDGVNLISTPSLPTVESEGVGYPTTSIPHEPSPDSPTYIPLVRSQVLQYLVQSYHPVAPSLRTSPPVNDTVRAARPYPKPASWALARAGGTRNIASSSTGPRHSNLDGVNLISTPSLPTVESEGVGYPTTSILHEPSLDSPTYIPLVRSQVPQYLDTQSYHPVAPSLRTSPPVNNTVRAAQPYPNPASWALARAWGTGNIASSSTGPRHSNLDGVNLISTPSLPTVESEGVGFPTTSILHEPSLDSPTYIPLVRSQVPQYLDTQSYHPVAPSLRTSPPVNDTVRAARPYPKPASWALARAGGTRNIASSSTSPRHSNLDGVNINTPSLHTVAEETGCASATTSLPHELSSNLPTHPPQVVLRRVPVPLLPWRTSGALTPQLGTVEFWTRDKATGEMTLGTYFADHFDPDPNRLLVNPDELPFPRKVENGYNINFVWPGYKQYEKKRLIHTPVENNTLREVRDLIYGAFAEFIRTSDNHQLTPDERTPEAATWRVGVDDPSAIHVEDLVLVRLRQTSLRYWVPEVDVLRTL